ncbi:SusC/RagA family TonB-linked outer membrane protein [Parabacteroides pacaensis]|uniref:SusC/RagA family TonB-linked outer membrane protein n=1 Tax=Parabacteroides pacaensis TaxID=2086575 RepID=UPI000D0FD9A2|nr:TonB-dependent receptor [Parabacteroides pacaensis]
MKNNLLIVFVMLLFSAASAAQNKMTVSGIVTDQTGETVISASVRVKGQPDKGTITDVNGKYQIQEVPANATLIFSYIGMKAQEIAIKGRSVLNVIMEEDNQLIDEVVVVGYGTAKKRDLTGSIATVKAIEIASKPSTNPLASIQGKVAGVQVVNTGRAGQDPEIRIRGTNSINGYTPLYVVDGLFTDNINYLNPADIESMEILKDPSSLAIFGVRGANGVIIITTKKAKMGETIVNINSSVGFKNITDKIELTNAAQFKQLYNEQRMNQGVDPFDYTNWTADTYWQDEIFQTGILTNNNVSITGSSEKNKYYMGIGYTMEEGSIKSEKLSKLTLNLSSEYSVTKFLRFGFQVNGVRMLPPDAKGVGSAIKAAPIAPVYDLETGLHYTLPDFQQAQVANPMIDIEQRGRHNRAQNHRVTGNIYGEVDLMKHLTFKATFSLDYASNEARSYSPIIYVYNPDLEEKKENTNTKESVSQSKSNQLSAQSDYLLTYANNFGNHNLTLTGGITTNYIEHSSLQGGRSQNIGFGIPIGDNPDKWWISIIDDASTATNGSSQYKRFTMSYLLRGLYNYNNRYLLNISYRRDGSSVFRRTGNTWDNFYSFGAGWVMSEENFMKNQHIIDFLKLKGSWGILGSQTTGGYNYPSYPTVVSSGSAVFGDNIVEGKGLAYLVSSTLGWEKNYSWEAGFDMRLLGQRLQLSPVYYNKTTKDLLTKVPGISGSVPGLQNTGEIRNKGVELTASWSDNIGKNWRYGISANLTTIDNEVLSLINKDYAIISGVSRVSEGYPIGYFYGYKVAGIYQNEDDIRLSELNKVGSVSPGDLKFADVDGDGQITEKDRTIIGNPTPDFTYGFNVNVGYKNFDLNIDMMGVYGNEIYRNWDSNAYAQFNYRMERMNRWHGEGTSNWEPILDPSRNINLEASDYNIEDGSFFRIRNIELGYTFNSSLLKKIYMRSLRLYANIQNLKTWSRNSGYTPEVGGSAIQFGVDSGSYPMPAVYTFGFNLTF